MKSVSEQLIVAALIKCVNNQLLSCLDLAMFCSVLAVKTTSDC